MQAVQLDHGRDHAPEGNETVRTLWEVMGMFVAIEVALFGLGFWLGRITRGER